MTRGAVASLLSLAFLACGGSDSASGPCAPRVGTYLVHYQQRPGGDCGSPADFLIVFDGSGKYVPPAGCKLTHSSETADLCDVTNEALCVDPKSGEHSDLISRAHWTTDGSSATVAEDATFEGTPSAAACHSLWDVTFTRQ